MSQPLAETVRHNSEAALADVIKALSKAAEGLSADARDAVTKAARDVKAAAEALRGERAPTLKDVAQKAALEIKEHPVVALAAAISAAAALVGVIAAATARDD